MAVLRTCDLRLDKPSQLRSKSLDLDQLITCTVTVIPEALLAKQQCDHKQCHRETGVGTRHLRHDRQE